ncbi:MAG TPA: hypothetical protein VFG42_09820 [Baekduia sp.]|uniref:hypothetical protein n=1 Tax=Baekduia sp. TaxID=2600305 RepID=UPI002D77529D|nr:hypothetical protein [Baekduia sp.]HET6507077.1 hypothetical protein [Baekduia sp.]
MHRIQRALVGYLIADLDEPRPAETGLMAVQGTTYYVPVLDGTGSPAAYQPIGYGPDLMSGLVVSDLEDDEVLDLLTREGLGAVAGVTWTADWHAGEISVHDHDLDRALARLADALVRVPGRYVPVAVDRADLDQVTIHAPSGAPHARAMADWSGDGGDLWGAVFADPGDRWPTELVRALQVAARARLGVAGVEAIRVALAEGEPPATVLEADPLRLEVSWTDYTPRRNG